jgi:UDP-glucose 4-epimerase
MKITVLGGSGFVGSHVADKLTEAGHKVIIYDLKKSKYLKKNQEMVIGDILNKKLLEKAISKSDIVYNFAAIADIDQSISLPIETAKINILGELNVLELCKKYSVKRHVFASTIYVYSLSGNFYRCSKQSAESFIEEYNKLHNLNYTILRFGSLYGPRSDKTNGIYKIIKESLKKKKMIYEGNKKAIREYIHVEDAADSSVKILEPKYKNKNLILTGQRPKRVYDVMKTIAKILGLNKKFQFKNISTSGHYIRTPYTYVPKIAKKFSQKTQIDLGKGLLKLIEEIKKEKN